MSDGWKTFKKKLNKIRRRRAAALMLHGFILALALVLAGLLVYGVLDWLLALPQIFRLVLSLALAGAVVIFFCVRVLKALNLSRLQIARLLDRVMLNQRSEILSACELGSAYEKDGGDDSIRGFFIGEVINEAIEKMKTLSLKLYYPRRETFRAVRLLLLILLVNGLICAIFPDAVSIIFKRIISPFEDVPPFSPYSFKISPAAPQVVYGGKLELTAEISGAPIRSQVLFVTRSANGVIFATPCFKLGDNKFAQKVERINAPVDFCFKTGRARSHWKRINILLQPRISMVKIKIQSPAYSMLPDKDFFTGTDVIKGLKGSKITLTVTSNRPLKSGYLKIVPEDMGKDKIIDATKSAQHSVTFNWTLDEAALLEFSIKDILGTKCRKPLSIKQYVRKDERPEITLQEPAGFIMATPDSVIDFSVTAEDDLGIKRIDIIRSISGFRDRVKALRENCGEKDYALDGSLDLKALGTSSGEDIDLYFEAFDYNPALTGVASSEMVKIKLISEAEYAKILRLKSSIRELEIRYNLVGAKLFEFRRALDSFIKALKKDGLSEKDKAGHIKKLQKTFEEARELIRKFAEDFAIYDIEKKHRETIKKILKKLEKSEKIIKSLDPAADKKLLLKHLENILKDSEESIKDNEEMQQDAELLALLERFFKETGKFTALVEDQKLLVKKLSVYKTDMSEERIARLSEYSEQETELLTRCKNIIAALKKIAYELPESEYKLSSHIGKFNALVKELKIEEYLQKAAEYAKFKNGSRAWHFAALALEKMLELIENKENQVSGACRGCSPGCLSKKLQRTACEMLESLLNRQGRGRGMGGGGAGGGDVNDGYFGGGASALNIPVIGPRRHFTDSRAQQSAYGEGGSGKGARRGIYGNRKVDRENMNVSRRTKTRTESVNLDQVPFKYRKAVKKYFGGQ